MVSETGHQHRAGNLKQQNKLHKHGRHRSKGSLEKLNKGRANAFRLTTKKRLELSREERRNQASQIRQKKRFEYIQKRREICEAPFLVSLIPLHLNVSTEETLKALREADPEASVNSSAEGHTHLYSPRLKQRFTFVKNSGDNLFDTLDILKVSDTVVFLVPINGIDENGEIILTSTLAQGLPTCLFVCTDLADVPQKKRSERKSRLEADMDRWVSGNGKVASLEKPGDALNLLRKVALIKRRPISMRDKRPHLLAESVQFIETTKGSGTLEVTGYLRGQPLSVNSLVHIPGWGDFQMSLIEAPPHPFSTRPLERRILCSADSAKQESLDSENPVDPMEGEQTWPTKEELVEAEEAAKRKKVKKVPHGFSEYQAAWIPDEDAVELEDGDGDEVMETDITAEGADEVDSEEEGDRDSEGDRMETGTEFSEAAPAPDKYDRDLDMAEEEIALKRIKEAQEDKEFPDEVDTPREVPARERFARYRGLASFRTSPWDPKENLPPDYARIFRFQNFDRTKRVVIKEQEEAEGALPGWYVTVHVVGVPTYMWRCRGEQPIAVIGLLKHEQKMSVLNMVLKRPPLFASDDPVKSKDPLLFQVGFRRFRCRPIFSQHTKGNKFKYERFFQPDATVVATTFAPIIYPPSSVLAFRENKDGSSCLLATGSILSVDPNRVVVKRAVLSGHPFKVHKRSAVVRFMFFNREDIDWFKPVELRTKYGRRGHIKEPLGTHGHMKCVFNGQLKSQDTILLNLYKRVFPKWSYDSNVSLVVNENQDDKEKE